MPLPTNAQSLSEGHTQDHDRWVDVKGHYEAVGDGVATDTAKLQAAHAAALAGPMAVFFPKGTYNHTGLTWDARVRMIGPSTTLDEIANSGAYLNYTPSTGTALTITNAATGSGPHIENIGLVGSSAANNTTGIYLDGPNSVATVMARGMLHNVRARKFGAGIKTSGALEITFLNCYGVENGQNLWMTNDSNACSVIGGAYRQATTNGIHIDGTGSVHIAPGVVVESNGTNGLLVDGANVSGLTIGGHYEGNGGRGIYLNGSPGSRINDSSIMGALFTANAAADIETTSVRQIKGFGLYFTDNGSITLDSDSQFCEFYGSRPPVITDNGGANYFFYPDTAVNAFLQIQSSVGYGVHFKNGILEMDAVTAPGAAPAGHMYVYGKTSGGVTRFFTKGADGVERGPL